MKQMNLKSIASALLIATVLATGQVASAQTAVTTTSSTTSSGTISEFSPDTIVVRSETESAPVRYSYSKSTTYVDDTGAPVSMDVVKSGLPVTVYYVKEGDRMVASKVVVKKRTTTTTEKPVVEQKRTSTTTTTTEK
jgi:hypothetical protein